MTEIRTERLILRTMMPGDSTAVFAWAGDERVNAFMCYAVYRSEDAVREWILSVPCETETAHELVIVQKSTGAVIGGCGIRRDEERGSWTFGYNLRFDAWGNGYATEAVRAMLDFIADRHAPCVFESTVAKENAASLRVMEKCGLSPHKETEYTKADGSRSFKAIVFRKEVAAQ